MKLRNKLIPLAGCLAVGATVAPISLTSCSNGSSFVDLKDGFKPTIKQAEGISGNELTNAEAYQLYFNKVAENPQVFAQDLNWSMSTALRVIAENPVIQGTEGRLIDDDSANVITTGTTIDSARAKVENIKVGQTSFTYSGVTQTRYTLSFDYVREQQLTTKLTDETTLSNRVVTGATKTTLKVSNIPFIFNRTSIGGRQFILQNDQDVYLSLDPVYKLSDAFQYLYSNGLVTPTSQDMHLGRCMFLNNYNVTAGSTEYQSRNFANDLFINMDSNEHLLIPCEWALCVDTTCLTFTKDEFSIEYSQDTVDTQTTTYNEQVSETTSTSHTDGKITKFADMAKMLVDPQSNIVGVQLLNWCVKPYYLQNIKVKA